jgi:hypothetical protein
VKSIKITEVYETSTRRQTFRALAGSGSQIRTTCLTNPKMAKFQTRYASRLKYALCAALTSSFTARGRLLFTHF